MAIIFWPWGSFNLYGVILFIASRSVMSFIYRFMTNCIIATWTEQMTDHSFTFLISLIIIWIKIFIYNYYITYWIMERKETEISFDFLGEQYSLKLLKSRSSGNSVFMTCFFWISMAIFFMILMIIKQQKDFIDATYYNFISIRVLAYLLNTMTVLGNKSLIIICSRCAKFGIKILTYLSVKLAGSNPNSR